MADAPCTALNACIPGFECDLYNTRTCKPLCRVGQNDCKGKGTCANSFKLPIFGNNDIGLCL